MSRVQITPEAKADLFEIWEYIASKSGVDAADRVLGILQKEISKIGEVPGGGHFREEFIDKSIRFWNIYSYLIAYRWEASPIEIVAVIHGARDMAVFLQDRL